jgi:ATP-dependent helicase/nuclease subunit B
MPVRFVLGRAGSGKTDHCYRAIVQAMRDDPLGPPIYWLLPKQATFEAERDLTCRSGLGAFCRARVVHFEQFGRDVLEDCGGTGIPEVTPLGRQMIIGHLLRQNRARLRFYSQVARQPGLALELDATFAEFERAGKSAAELDELIAGLSESNAADLELAPLLDKLRDVSLLYNQYAAYLGQDRLDQHRRLVEVEASLANCRFLRSCHIYVDGFLDFTNYERRILVGAAKAGASIDIAMLVDPKSPLITNPHLMPDDMGVFRKTEDAYRRLYFAFSEAGIPIADPLLRKEPRRFSSRAIGHLETNLFKDRASASDDAEGIELSQSPDRAHEVNVVARRIQELTSTGLRLRDIAVLVRSLEIYQDLIALAFKEHDIPCFLDRRRTATHHPLIEFLRAIFQIALHNWPHDAAMSLLRTGLAAVDLFDTDGLENYVLTHRITGVEGWEPVRPWDYKPARLSSSDDAILSPASESTSAESIRTKLVERLGSLLSALPSTEPLQVRRFATEIFAALDRFGVRRTIADWIRQAESSGQKERAAEHTQVWRNFVDLFDQLVELLGHESMTPAEFFDVLEAGFESFDLAITPQTVDQVLVGQVDRARIGPVKAVFVLGLSEGEFPRPAGDTSILSDHDRRSLRKRRIELDPAMHERLLDERLLAYIAFTRASDYLITSRSASDEDGRETEPSDFWRRVTEIFPTAPVAIATEAGAAPVADIATPRQLVTSLMRWVRSSDDPASDPDSTCAALYQWLATRPASHDQLDQVRSLAWPALSFINAASLSNEVAASLFVAPLVATVRQLETFAECSYRHFARYGLSLRDREDHLVTAQDMGRLYHELLETSLKDVMRRRAEGDKNARLEVVIGEFVDRVGASLRQEIMLGSARNRYLLDRARRIARLIALAQREILKRGLFRPAHVGLTFGPAGNLPALKVETPRGELLLHGKIDRVDRVDSTGDFAAIDYRLSQNRLPIGMVLHGLSLQLLSSLLVLEAHADRLSGRTLEASGAFYHQLIRKIESVDHPEECVGPTDPTWHLKLKPRGLFDLSALPKFDKELTTGNSEVVQAFIKQDGTLGRANFSDAASSQDFRALLELTAAKLAEIGAAILSGRIDIAPYRLSDHSPCPHCEYRSLCRFDPAINKYNFLPSLSRHEVLGRFRSGAGAEVEGGSR